MNAVPSTTGAIAPWLAALHASSLRLAAEVAPLTREQLTQPSFAEKWTVAQVLSHLGSAAEISTGIVERGLAGDTAAPRREDVAPLWERWDATPPAAQREAWLEADARHRTLLDSLADRAAEVQVPYFAGLLSLPVYAGYRLSEQSVHAWDIEVALDPAATIPDAEVALLWDRIDLVASRFRDAGILTGLAPATLSVHRTDRDLPAALLLDSGELHLYPCEPADPDGRLTGPTEQLLRLVYGRHRADHDALDATGPVTLADLRRLFPGF